MKQVNEIAKGKIATIINISRRDANPHGKEFWSVLKQIVNIASVLTFIMIVIFPVYADAEEATPSSDNRIATLANLIKNLADNGVTFDEAIGIALTLNNHINPPLSDKEVDAAVHSVYNKPSAAEEDEEDSPSVPEKQVETTSVGQQTEQQKEGLPSWAPKILGLQFNGIYQNVPGFRSPYEGANSFRTDGGLGHNITHIYGVYLGSQLATTLRAYVDIEMAKGSGVSKGEGLGGYPDGDVIRVGTVDLGTGPYIARAYLRYFYPLSLDAEDMERGQDQLPGKEPLSRFEVKAGKMCLADDFDLNRYANNTRTSFLITALSTILHGIMQPIRGVTVMASLYPCFSRHGDWFSPVLQNLPSQTALQSTHKSSRPRGTTLDLLSNLMT